MPKGYKPYGQVYHSDTSWYQFSVLVFFFFLVAIFLKVYFDSEFENTACQSRGIMGQDQEAVGHIIPPVRMQGEVNAGA